MFLKVLYPVMVFFQSRLEKYFERASDEKYRNKIKSSFSKLSKKKRLTAEQKREIQDFFKKTIGHEVPIDWHQYFYSRTGVFSKF